MMQKFFGLFFLLSSQLFSAEISLLSGVFQSESSKLGGADNGGRKVVSIGGRYLDDLYADKSERQAWYGQVGVVLSSYDAPDGGKAPDNHMGYDLGGGYRYYFAPWNSFITPFVAGSGKLSSVQTVSTVISQTRTTGLYYGGHGGIKFDLDRNFFMELEMDIFESPLFETTTSEKVNPTATDKKAEETKVSLFVNSRASVNDIHFNFGMNL